MTTTATCFYHPNASAARQCAQCSLPLCDDCVETVASQSVCRRCVSAIRARVSAQMNTTPSYQQPSFQGGVVNAAPSTSGPYGGDPSAAADTSPGRLMLGILAATAIGVVGAVLWEKIYFHLGFGLSLIYLGIGIAVAWALVKVSGQHNGFTAPLAGLLTLAALAVGHLVLAYDATGEMSLRSLTFICEHMGPMHWICVALGLGGAYRSVDQASQG